MKKNVGAADGYIRVLVALGLLVNIFCLDPAPGFWGLLLIVVLSVGLIKSAFSSYCPLYTLLKISTIPENPKPAEPVEAAGH